MSTMMAAIAFLAFISAWLMRLPIYQRVYLGCVHEHVRLYPTAPRYKGVVPGAIARECLVYEWTAAGIIALSLFWLGSPKLAPVGLAYLTFAATRTGIWFLVLRRHAGVAHVPPRVLRRQSVRAAAYSVLLDVFAVAVLAVGLALARLSVK